MNWNVMKRASLIVAALLATLFLLEFVASILMLPVVITTGAVAAENVPTAVLGGAVVLAIVAYLGAVLVGPIRSLLWGAWRTKRGTRLILAFCLSPAVVGLVLDLLVLFNDPAGPLANAESVFDFAAKAFSGVTADIYGFMFFIGAPLFVYLVRRRRTSLWIAAVCGAALGMIGVALPFGTFVIIGFPITFLIGVPIFGSIGAAIGVVFWVIARPDRWKSELDEAVATPTAGPASVG